MIFVKSLVTSCLNVERDCGWTSFAKGVAHVYHELDDGASGGRGRTYKVDTSRIILHKAGKRELLHLPLSTLTHLKMELWWMGKNCRRWYKGLPKVLKCSIVKEGIQEVGT